jgi:hypothetical protein
MAQSVELFEAWRCHLTRAKICGSIMLCHSREIVAALDRLKPFRIKASRTRKRISAGSEFKVSFSVESWGETCYT